MTKGENPVEYRALAGLNYVSTKTGKEKRVEQGGLVADMSPTSVKHELKAGNLTTEDQTSLFNQDGE